MFSLIYTGAGLAHAQDMSDQIPLSLSPRSSPSRDPHWSIPHAAALSPQSLPDTDTMKRQTAEFAVMGEQHSEVNYTAEVMDLATGIQNQLSADDEIEVHEPQDATSSYLQESYVNVKAPSKHTNLPLEVKSKIVPGTIFNMTIE